MSQDKGGEPMQDQEKKPYDPSKNLIPAKKGEVRNPKGRGKSLNRSTILKKLLETKMDMPNPLKKGKVEKKSTAEWVEIALIKRAMGGDVRANQLVMEKLFGKVPLDVNLGGQTDNPIKEEKKIEQLSFEQLYELKHGKPYVKPE